jgi:hypothetical protein
MDAYEETSGFTEIVIIKKILFFCKLKTENFTNSYIEKYSKNKCNQNISKNI